MTNTEREHIRNVIRQKAAQGMSYAEFRALLNRYQPMSFREYTLLMAPLSMVRIAPRRPPSPPATSVIPPEPMP